MLLFYFETRTWTYLTLLLGFGSKDCPIVTELCLLVISYKLKLITNELLKKPRLLLMLL